MEWLIIAVILVFVVWRASRARSKTGASAVDAEKRYARLEGDGDYELDIVGESHYQDALDTIAGGKTEDGHELECEAILERERNNPHDPNAVAVYIDDKKVGYLSRPHARRLSAILDKQKLDGGVAEAIIVGGWRRANNDEGHYGVRLDIPV